jgi:hypothetical protein
MRVLLVLATLALVVAAFIGVAHSAAATPEASSPDLVEMVVADPGDQSWFLCVDNRPYGTGYVYNDFMVSSTVAQCFVDYSAPPPGCPHIYRYQVWWTPQYGGWTGPHSIGHVCA